MLKLGDTVRKSQGYGWPGVIVSVYHSLKGEVRYVVECTSPDIAGAQHIFNASQLILVKSGPVIPNSIETALLKVDPILGVVNPDGIRALSYMKYMAEELNKARDQVAKLRVNDYVILALFTIFSIIILLGARS